MFHTSCPINWRFMTWIFNPAVSLGCKRIRFQHFQPVDRKGRQLRLVVFPFHCGLFYGMEMLVFLFSVVSCFMVTILLFLLPIWLMGALCLLLRMTGLNKELWDVSFQLYRFSTINGFLCWYNPILRIELFVRQILFPVLYCHW